MWLLVAAARGVGWDQFTVTFAAADPGLLAATFAVNLLRYAIWGTRWWLLIRPLARPRWRDAFVALMGSVFVNTVIPAARPFGGWVRARQLADG